MNNTLQTFQEILSNKGLMPSEIIADGKLHRCPTQAKPHKRNGAYIAHLDTPATLWWCNWDSIDQGTFTEAEKTAFPGRKGNIATAPSRRGAYQAGLGMPFLYGENPPLGGGF